MLGPKQRPRGRTAGAGCSGRGDPWMWGRGSFLPGALLTVIHLMGEIAWGAEEQV